MFSALTAVLSAFLDNVTTMLLIAPVTLRLSSVVQINPIPLLLSEVFFCNLGGTATMIGDPPNIILGAMFTDYVDFVSFIVNLGPCILVTCFPCFGLLWFFYRNHLEDSHYDALAVQSIKNDYPIKDKRLLIKTGIVLGLVMIFFFFETFIHLEPAWAALGGGAVLLLVSSRHEVEDFLHKVEWSTLLFFCGLFVMIGGLEEMGLIEAIGDGVASIVRSTPPDSRLTASMMLILFVSAIASALIDNIPFTATMAPVILQLAQDAELQLPLLPLLWSLALGACLGGNGTLIGASANLVAVGIADRAGFKISFASFTRVGVPFMLLSVLCSALYLQIVYAWLGWGLGPRLYE
jgi:Na+/H+ antiporter NhaD/arsenite permease-like protein